MEGTTDIHDTCLLKGIRKVSQKMVPLHNGFITYYVITYVTWGISFDEIMISLESCIATL